MHASSYQAQPDGSAAIALFELVLTGPLRKVEAIPGGGWIITPVVGRELVLTGADEVAAYVQQAHGTGPQALAPAAAPAPRTPAAETGCECTTTARTGPGSQQADVMQARAINGHLGDWVEPERRAAGWDADAGAAAVRIHTPHGLYVLFVPPVGRAFPIFREGRRDGALDVRRVPGTRDSLVATLLAAYLRDRGEL